MGCQARREKFHSLFLTLPYIKCNLLENSLGGVVIYLSAPYPGQNVESGHRVEESPPEPVTLRLSLDRGLQHHLVRLGSKALSLCKKLRTDLIKIFRKKLHSFKMKNIRL